MVHNSLNHQAMENIEKLKQHLLSFTCRLVRPVQADFEILGIASGFIVVRSNVWFLLSAGHALRKGNWVLETDVSFESTNETVAIPLAATTFKSFNLSSPTAIDLEFAFAVLNRDMLEKQAQKDSRLVGKDFDFVRYIAPLGHEPILQKEAYSYASWNRASYELHDGKRQLRREASYEFGMTYQGRSADGRVYHFKLDGRHKGHEYYDHASGSPITDPEGKVVSLLLGGDDKTDMLYGLPIKDYLRLLDIEIHRISSPK